VFTVVVGTVVFCVCIVVISVLTVAATVVATVLDVAVNVLVMLLQVLQGHCTSTGQGLSGRSHYFHDLRQFHGTLQQSLGDRLTPPLPTF